jgi:hypothetical protein
MLSAAHRFILTHDDSKAFLVLYIGLAVVLALWIGLFWLAVVVGVHLLFEIIKQHHHDPRPLPVLARALWEVKLDVGLVLCGLVIGLYIDVLFGIVGIGHAGRAGAQTAARVGLWQRGIRGALLTVDDVAMVAKGVAVRGKKTADEASLAATGTDGGSVGSEGPGPEAAEAALPEPPASPPAGGAELWGDWVAPRWTLGDRFSLGFTILNVVLILAAPLLTDHTVASTWAEILSDLHPFPER